MKILHISTIIEWRGGDKQLLTSIEILKDYPDILHVVLCPEGSVLSQKCIEHNITHYTASRKSKFSVPFLTEISKVVKKENVNIIHVHDSNALSLTSFVIKFLPGIKLIYSRKRNNRVKNNYLKRIKYNNARITGIVCNSNAVADVLLPVLKNPGVVEVIYDGINVEESAQYNSKHILKKEFGISHDTLIIGNFAGLTNQKDIFTFLDAARLILDQTDKKIKFFMVGEGPLEIELKNYSISKGLEKDVIFPGFRKDFHHLLPELDIFMLSSQAEGLPLTVLEAFCCKVPVVATAAGGTGEAVKNLETGMLSPVKDPEALATNALKLISNQALAKELTENAFQLVSQKFTLEVMKKEYYRYYKSIASK